MRYKKDIIEIKLQDLIKFQKILKILILIILYHLIKKKTKKIIINKILGIMDINIQKFLKLLDKPKNPNDPLIFKEKQNFLNFISKCSGYNITQVDNIFLTQNFNFGNILIILNKVIFYCEILKCKKIILNKNNNCFIKKIINYSEYNMTIEVGDQNEFFNHKTIFDISDNFLFYYSYIKPEFRLNIIKNEIINNLPKVEIKPNNLYIYIRSGDIFKIYNSFYSQPPLCFYKNIINNYKFNKIYIIAQDNINPVINQLITKYPNIIFHTHSLEIDVAYLINAYNIVGGTSTFINIIIRLNTNLKFFWEYNIDSTKAKIIHFHHSFYKPFKNITYFRMEPSYRYKKEMSEWNHTESQLNLMINENCSNNFKIFNEYT